MKRLILLLLVTFVSLQVANAQTKTWSELSKEEKMMKLKAFREDNQKYLKSLGMTATQLEDIDNVNACYLTTLDRINRYGKTDEDKEKLADVVTSARSVQLDAIMGTENRDKFMNYVSEKLKKAKM